ncbi:MULTISPECIES: glycosyltransferase [unclassified Methanoregula]|uniref:glycosyltransferase n=1 Tax=unclassified Methanoregula TaxID=2649730 RepID=UPI0009CEEA1F|nr:MULTISPECIES: glycosyltransferase [unclassified Methanoregula]OPX63688.1 MAG: Glycosyltransferase AglE [Methanoregula sp. PtaB.Bin085]OPY36145.1 MAG: Glycosyltransferase AglE [Methanoregula sp. PtaU1.Bin006]
MQSRLEADPLVSICIPVYNAEATIERTLRSVTGQTWENLEIIIVDNLSSDGTLTRVRAFHDPRIRIVENPVHFTCAEFNWNTCFEHARGEFIALFHADDMYAPDMIARQVAVFSQFPDVNGVFTNGDMIDEQDSLIGSFRLPPGIAGNTPYTYRDILPVVLEYDNFLLCPSAMVRSGIYKTLAPFRYEQFGSASDLDMWLRVAKTGRIVIIDKNLLKYRMSTTQWSHSLKTTTQARDFFRVMDFHIAENRTCDLLSADTLAKYELRRLEDQVFISLNYARNGNFSGLWAHTRSMPWGRYLRIIITKPCISIPFLAGGFIKLAGNIFRKQ